MKREVLFRFSEVGVSTAAAVAYMLATAPSVFSLQRSKVDVSSDTIRRAFVLKDSAVFEWDLIAGGSYGGHLSNPSIAHLEQIPWCNISH